MLRKHTRWHRSQPKRIDEPNQEGWTLRKFRSPSAPKDLFPFCLKITHRQCSQGRWPTTDRVIYELVRYHLHRPPRLRRNERESMKSPKRKTSCSPKCSASWNWYVAKAGQHFFTKSSLEYFLPNGGCVKKNGIDKQSSCGYQRPKIPTTPERLAAAGVWAFP